MVLSSRASVENLSPSDIDKLVKADLEFELEEDDMVEGKHNTACFKSLDDAYKAMDILNMKYEKFKGFGAKR